MALTNLRFRYEIIGDKPSWHPVRAWDDGRKAYVEFPVQLDQGEAAPLFVVGPLGDSELVNYRVSGNDQGVGGCRRHGVAHRLHALRA